MIAVSWGKPEPESPLWIPPNFAPMKQALMRLCRNRGARYSEIVGKRRSRSISNVRQDFMLEIREEFPEVMLSDIARLFDRDHTTILYGLKLARLRNASRRLSASTPSKE